MINLLFDEDVQMALLTLITLLILYIINDSKWKYKENWRYWVGTIAVSMGIAATITNIINKEWTWTAEAIGGMFWIPIGLSIWLIKAKRKCQSQKK